RQCVGVFPMSKGAFNRCLRWTMQAASLAAVGAMPVLDAGRVPAAEPIKAGHAGDELFTNVLVSRLRIEIPPEGMAVLQSYEWNRYLNGQDRSNVLATVREG